MAIKHSELLDLIRQSDITAEDLDKIVAELKLSAVEEKSTEQTEEATVTRTAANGIFAKIAKALVVTLITRFSIVLT